MDGNDNIINTACAHPSAHPISVMGSIMGELYHCYRPHYKTGVANMVGHYCVQHLKVLHNRIDLNFVNFLHNFIGEDFKIKKCLPQIVLGI